MKIIKTEGIEKDLIRFEIKDIEKLYTWMIIIGGGLLLLGLFV